MFQEGLKKSEDNRLQKLASKEPAGYDGTTQHVMVGAIEGPKRIGFFFTISVRYRTITSQSSTEGLT